MREKVEVMFELNDVAHIGTTAIGSTDDYIVIAVPKEIIVEKEPVFDENGNQKFSGGRLGFLKGPISLDGVQYSCKVSLFVSTRGSLGKAAF